MERSPAPSYHYVGVVLWIRLDDKVLLAILALFGFHIQFMVSSLSMTCHTYSHRLVFLHTICLFKNSFRHTL